MKRAGLILAAVLLGVVIGQASAPTVLTQQLGYFDQLELGSSGFLYAYYSPVTTCYVFTPSNQNHGPTMSCIRSGAAD